MTQPNKKANCGDRITDLPGNVIDCILKHMNIRDLVRTTILSTKWRYMWISVPQLQFDDDNFYDLFDNLEDPSRIITKILFLHNGPVDKFIFRLPYKYKHKMAFEYLNMWILFLSRKGVKHIELANDEEGPVGTPSHLFSCKGLTYFKFRDFNLSIPPSFSGFKNLLHLHFQYMTFELGALETLLSGCPLLENLSIDQCSGCECIDLSFSTALVDLTLSLPQNFIFGLNQSLQRLTLESKSKMLLYTGIFPLSQLIMNLKYLRLDAVNLDGKEELLYIVSVLKNASNLVELHIVTNHGSGYKIQAPDPSEKLECSSSCLSQLQTVNISVVSSSVKHTMSLARFVLANSSSLKTLTFDLGFSIKPPVLSSISRDLLWMERASQRAHVVFLHR